MNINCRYTRWRIRYRSHRSENQTGSASLTGRTRNWLLVQSDCILWIWEHKNWSKVIRTSRWTCYGFCDSLIWLKLRYFGSLKKIRKGNKIVPFKFHYHTRMVGEKKRNPHLIVTSTYRHNCKELVKNTSFLPLIAGTSEELLPSFCLCSFFSNMQRRHLG